MSVSVTVSRGTVEVICSTGTRQIKISNAQVKINNTNTSLATVYVQFYLNGGNISGNDIITTRTYRVPANTSDVFYFSVSRTLNKSKLSPNLDVMLMRQYKIGSGNWEGTKGSSISKTKLTTSDLYAKYKKSTYVIAEDVVEGNDITFPTTSQVPGATRWFMNSSYYGTGYPPAAHGTMPYNASSRFYIYAPSATIDISYDSNNNTNIGIGTSANSYGGYINSILPIVFNNNIVMPTEDPLAELNQTIIDAGWSDILIT